MWLLRVHYNTTMHAVFFVLSPVSWKTNVTKFSVVFTHKLLYNAGNNSVKTKENNRLKKKEKRASSAGKLEKRVKHSATPRVLHASLVFS